MTREELAVTTDNERYWLFDGPCRATLAGRRPVRGRTPTQAMTIDTERLRELAAELGFWPATTDEADIEHRQHNKNADYWLARSHRFDRFRREQEEVLIEGPSLNVRGRSRPHRRPRGLGSGRRVVCAKFSVAPRVRC